MGQLDLALFDQLGWEERPSTEKYRIKLALKKLKNSFKDFKRANTYTPVLWIRICIHLPPGSGSRRGK